MSEEELKEKFVSYFGEEKWNQEEALSNLWPLEILICDDLGIEPIPIITDNIEEDARLYDKEDYIVISEKLILDEVEAIKCVIHELRHVYQKVCVTNCDNTEPLLKLWIDEQNSPINLMSYSEQMCLSIEIDAYAYQKYMLKVLYDIDWHHPNTNYDYVVEHYMEKYLN